MQLKIREAVVLVKVVKKLDNETVLLRVLQRNRTDRMYIYIHTYR